MKFLADLRVRLIVVIIVLTYFCLIQVCTLWWDNLINRCIFYSLDRPLFAWTIALGRCKNILMTFFMSVYKFRIFSFNQISRSLEAELSFIWEWAYHAHRNTNPLVGTRISTDGNRANYARKTRETDENLKRNERCDNTEILFWPHGPLRPFISCFILIAPLYFSS